MSRLDNWQNNLSAVIIAKRAEPFEFSKHNCLLWAFDAIEAITGIDHSKDYRGQYKTEKQAAKLLRKVDKIETSQQLLELKLGQEAQPIAFARMGDIVLAVEAIDGLELPGDTQLFGAVPGVCYGVVSYFVGEQGLIEIETLKLNGVLWVS